MKTVYCSMIWTFSEMGAPRFKEDHKLPPNNIIIEAADGIRVPLRREEVNRQQHYKWIQNLTIN
eukprot:9213029-Ditylum_brightwellii.AAC.1